MIRLLVGMLAGTAIFAASAQTSHAADLPMKAPPMTVVDRGGWYFWVDGSYQNVHLPKFDLGWRNLGVAAPFADRGPTETYSPNPTGAGVAAALGYMLPHGTLPGTNGRIEFGGSYVHASQTESNAGAALTGATSGLGFFLPLLNGTQALGGFQCGIPACSTNSTLSTSFTEWRLNGKVATDYVMGTIVLTPSATLFGGHSKSHHDFSQNEGFVGSPVAVFYSATVNLGWNDVGVKFGLDGKVAVSQWLAFGLGGSIGVAHRHVDLSAADAVSAGGPAIATSAIAASRTLTPFLGNAEARMFLTPWSNNVVFKGFAGINYDSKVPGISSPAFDSAFPAPGTNVRPANIKTEAETSFYAGGGVTVRF